MRHTLGWASITLVVGAVGCGGTAFVATTGDAGDDATTQGDTGVKGPDAGHRADAGVDGHHEGTDAKKPGDGGEKKDTGLDGPVVTPDTGVDAGVDATGGKDAGEDTAVPVDAGHDVGVDAGPPPCRVADSTKGIFASPSGVASMCGTFQTPCSITEAISQAAAKPTPFNVYLQEGTYPLAAGFTLSSSVSLLGGWTVTPEGWTADCSPTANTDVVLTNTNETTLPVTGITGVTLDTLTIQNGATAAAGESLYALFATGSTLILNDVVITVRAGGAGVPGVASTDPGTMGGACNAPGTSTPATQGAAGVVSTAGASGFTLGAAGGLGGTGGNGANGVAGTDTPCTSGYTACVRPAGSPQGVCTTANNNPSLCATGGKAGCGGTGGGGGMGGTGGGSSIGVFVWGGSVTVTGGSITTGAGGAGGSGGAPAAGGAPSAGGGGSSSTKPILTCSYDSTTMACVAATYGPSVGPGPSGTAGKAGAGGAAGGGGAGGDSYQYYFGNGASNGLSVSTMGSVGAAGAAGSPNGPPGTSAPHN